MITILFLLISCTVELRLTPLETIEQPVKRKRFLTGLSAVREAFANEETENFFEELELLVGELKTLPATNPKRVAVARPEIADVQSVASNEVTIEPKAAGRTTLFIWDAYGRHSYQLKVTSEDFFWLKKHADSIIQELNLPGISTKINTEEGKLLLTGEVNELNEKERLLTALESLRDKLLDLVTIKEERTLVQIDVQILEINRDNLKNLGIEYPTAVTLTDDANKKMNKISDMFATSMWTRSKLDVTINLLIKQSKARILSQPKLVSLSGKEAEFLVGGQIPIVTATVSTVAVATTAQFKDYGINLKIEPTVKDKTDIFLKLSTEVSEIDVANSVKTSLATVPAFLTRTAKSELYLKDGQSVIIAGLIKNKDSNTVKKFPFLGDVPILGLLWRSRDFQLNQTELVILITPTVVQNSQVSQNKTSSPSVTSKISDELKSNRLSFATQDRGSELDSYREDLRSRIISALTYPSLASELDARGTLKVRLRILSDGQLKDAYVLDSSGSQLLDNAAINTIKNLAPFPAFPSSVDTNEIAIDISIVYS